MPASAAQQQSTANLLKVPVSLSGCICFFLFLHFSAVIFFSCNCFAGPRLFVAVRFRMGRCAVCVARPAIAIAVGVLNNTAIRQRAGRGAAASTCPDLARLALELGSVYGLKPRLPYGQGDDLYYCKMQRLGIRNSTATRSHTVPLAAWGTGPRKTATAAIVPTTVSHGQVIGGTGRSPRWWSNRPRRG